MDKIIFGILLLPIWLLLPILMVGMVIDFFDKRKKDVATLKKNEDAIRQLQISVLVKDIEELKKEVDWLSSYIKKQ